MIIEIWSDFICPFCYMGKKKFEMALNEFEHKDEVEVIYRSFELGMSAESVKGKDIHRVIADKYHISYEDARENNDRIVKAAAEVGLHYRFDLLKLNSTKLAHEIVQYAKTKGKEKELVNRFFQGYFEEGMDIGDREALLKHAEEAGLDIADLTEQLDGQQLKAAVKKDEDMAEKLNINGVPYFLINQWYAVSGAQNPDTFLHALQEAYESEK
ncbi:DsbA family oxidoreductase [Lacrimispora amygdalina]|uniref:DsbA family oxidoreductase n=1 Tax=Lacrimispora amygdalina TaxID=253257 RepID=UPI000BE2B8DC|nr:DsbA family oxidoreductase [Lacrimispora amygdalina]